MKNIALIAYSGHAYVVFETFFSQGLTVSAYADVQENKQDPFALKYLGNENDASVIEKLKNEYLYHVAVGDNKLRQRISTSLLPLLGPAENALHKTAIISRSMHAGNGNLFGPRVVVNSLARIGNGVILNTACVVEHECVVNDYAHIAPGAVLCGNVMVGEAAFVGAGAVVKQGVQIGKHAIIGAGAVVINDVPDHACVVGNPAKVK